MILNDETEETAKIVKDFESDIKNLYDDWFSQKISYTEFQKKVALRNRQFVKKYSETWKKIAIGVTKK